MSQVGIIRRIDELGRIVVPKEIRRFVGIVEGDPIEINTDGTSITLTKFDPTQKYDDILGHMRRSLEDDDLISIEKKSALYQKLIEMTNIFYDG